MSTSEFKIGYLSGSRFKRALVAGAKRVIARHDHLNKINVYPVSDSDTGTNVSITLSAGLRAVALEQEETVPNVLAAFADGTLESARGNSGTIFAQFFQGMSDAVVGKDEINHKDFIHIFCAGAAHAYRAVAQPMEGTVLTVLNDVSDYLSHLNPVPEDFAVLFLQLVECANKSLQETPEKMKMLKKFGVVDAGAQAMVDFFEGIAEFIARGDIKDLEKEMAAIIENEMENLHGDASAAGTDSLEEYNYRFCTECVIVGEDIDQEQLKIDVGELGDSLVVAGSKRKTKLHMHVNEPAKLFSFCRRYGKLLNEKADDMFLQVHDSHGKHSDVAIITDSSIDLPKDLLEHLNIHVIPIRIHIDEEAFIDGISITPEEFYHIVEERGTIPKTAHPTYRDFKAKYQFLATHYKSLISIHIGRNMSNTANAAELVKRDMAKIKLDVIDSRSTTAALGFVAQYAAELANAGYPHEQILKLTREIVNKTELYGVLESLDYAVKGGRMPKFVKTIADIFGVCPIVHMRREEKAKIIGFGTGVDSAIKKFGKKLLKSMNSNKKYRIGIVHCKNLKGAEKLLNYLNDHARNIESSFMMDCGVTIGSHTGPGTLGVAIQEYVPVKPL
jgi:DegV family protein with EDD domain